MGTDIDFKTSKMTSKGDLTSPRKLKPNMASKTKL